MTSQVPLLEKLPAHPQVILIELLATRQRAPRNEFVNIGVTRIVADMFTLNPGPSRARNDLSRLRGDVTEPDLVMVLAFRQMRMLTPRGLFQCFPCFDRYFAIGFGRQHQDGLGGIDCGFHNRAPLGHALGPNAIQRPKVSDFSFSVPTDALTAVAKFF